MNPVLPPEAERVRLDALLVERGLFATRSRARDAIMRGTVSVGGSPALKPGLAVHRAAVLSVDDPARRWVSRSALKLVAGLDAFGFDPNGLVCLDLGASTGGFTQVLLARGASCVFAVDVGHGQLDRELAADPRVRSIEGLNARNIVRETLDGVAPRILVADMSFISLRLALPPALSLCAPGAFGVFLVKPQFEAGREAIGKGGILRDAETAVSVAGEVAGWLGTQPGWRSLGIAPSPIEGSDGNREFLLGAVKDRG